MIGWQDLRAARQRRGVSLGKLAEMTGRDKSHLSRVERGERDVTPALVRDYERALGTDLSEVSGKESPNGTELADSVVTSERLGRTDGVGPLIAELISRQSSTYGEGTKSPLSDTANIAEVEDTEINDLAQIVALWATRTSGTMDRRDVLTHLSTAFAVAAASPALEFFDSDGADTAVMARGDVAALGRASIANITENLVRCRQQGDILGPGAALHMALAQHQVLVRAMRTNNRVESSVLAAHAELNQLIGWLLFNLGDYRGAQHYYEEARAAAHEAHEVELVTYVLCAMSHLATWQGRPRVGIDHAVAAAQWAGQTDSASARAYAADVAVRAFVADGDATASRKALDDEQAAVASLSTGEQAASWWYFYDESFYWGTEAEYALRFGLTEQAHTAAKRSLVLADRTNMHNYAFGLLLKSEALITGGEVAEASRIIGDVASLTGRHQSHRISQRIISLRKSLTTWQEHQAVRELDERLIVASAQAPQGHNFLTKRT